MSPATQLADMSTCTSRADVATAPDASGGGALPMLKTKSGKKAKITRQGSLMSEEAGSGSDSRPRSKGRLLEDDHSHSPSPGRAFNRQSTVQSLARYSPSRKRSILAIKKKETLMFQVLSSPGKLRLRELDPRRVVSQQSHSARVVVDWRQNRWEGTNRLIETMLPSPRVVQYTQLLTGAARASHVPDDNCDPSDEDDETSSDSDDDAVVNSDDEASSKYTGSAVGSTATGSRHGSTRDRDSCSEMTKEAGNASRKHHQMQSKVTGWLSQYSGCSKGHGERLFRKIYKPKCGDIHVKVNSGVKELLITQPPCFCSLQAVSFRNFLIGNRGVQALWPLLRYARVLKSLNLVGNDIHDTGVQHILQVLEADAQAAGKDDISCLLLVDLSRNPITGALVPDLMHFNDARKDVLMLGLADTNMPQQKRQRILRQGLAKFAGVEAHLMLEAWRLARDPLHFFDRQLFLQAERIVESTHGNCIFDMQEVSRQPGAKRTVGWHDADHPWVEDDDEWGANAYCSFDGGKDGFGGLDDSPRFDPRSPDAFVGRDGFGGLDDADELSISAQARDTPFSDASMITPVPPTPPPPTNPFVSQMMDMSRQKSWAMRRRRAATDSPKSQSSSPRVGIPAREITRKTVFDRRD
jgi:hypothetical protein